MLPLSVCLLFSLCTLSKLVTVEGYTYQSKPLFMSFSDLAALEANSWDQTSDPNPGDPVGERKVKTFEVICHHDSIEVVMKAHLLDPSLPIEPTHLRLGLVGADPCVASVSGAGEYVIRAPLTECGSQIRFTEKAVLYHNLLLYSPPPSPERAFQAERASVPVQCEYKRRYKVSSRALIPTWSPLIWTQATPLHLDFHLRLMTKDWSSERKSSVYFLGEMVNIEASVDVADHPPPPLRLYVDSCVATLTPDVTSYPRYPFIDHQGCFADSQLNGSGSGFLPRVRDGRLQIQLEPFLFYQDHRHTIYITCYLEAAPISKKDSVKKACSFRNGRWRSVDGDDDVCESCAREEEAHNTNSIEPAEPQTGHKRALRSKTKHRRNALHEEAALGPLVFLPRKAPNRSHNEFLYQSNHV